MLDYFKKQWISAGVTVWDGDLSFINKVLMDSDNADLCGDVSADEIEEVVKTMP